MSRAEGGHPARDGGAGRRGLRFRVLVLVVVGVLLPAALGAGMTWHRLRALDEELVAGRREAATGVADAIDDELTAELAGLQRIASAIPGRRSAQERLAVVRELLRAPGARSTSPGGTFLLDRDGRVLVQEPPGRAVAPAPGAEDVAATLRDGRPRVTGLLGRGEDARVYALVPVADLDGDGDLDGVLGSVVEPAAGWRPRALGHLLRGRPGQADLVDAAGLVLASSARARARGASGCFAVELVARRVPWAGELGGCLPDREPAIVAFAPLRVAPWGVLVAQREEDVLATAGGIARSFVLFGAVLFTVALGFAGGAAWSVTRPIRLLGEAAERIAAGELDERIPELGEDELGRLGRSVEHMRATLRGLLADLAAANERLEARVAERTRELHDANEALRERDAQRQKLLRTVITAQEDERKRIARELHDETTQSLAVLAMGLESAAAALRSGGPTPRLDEVKALAVRTLEEVHRIILDLRPAVLDDLGLFSALRWYAERYLSTRGIAVRCEIEPLERRLPPEIEIALFRIGQEAMTNVARHAKAESVLVEMGASGGELHIAIEDDGEGFVPGTASDGRPHYGLLGIRERVELLGGALDVDSAPGKGTRIAVRVPLPPQAPAPERLSTAAAGR